MEAIIQNDTWILLVLGLGLLIPFLLKQRKTAHVDEAPISQHYQTQVQTSSTPRWLASWQSLYKGRQQLDHAHQMAVQTTRPFALPGFFGDSVVLPPVWIPWLMRQSESVFSSQRFQLDFFDTQTTMLNKIIGKSPVHGRVIRKKLNAHLDVLPAMTVDEIGLAFAEHWGTDSVSTREIDISSVMMTIAARVASRVFVGKELASNLDYTTNCINYINGVTYTALALNALPKFLRPLLSPMLTIPNRIFHGRSLRHLQPFFEQQLEAHTSDPANMPCTYASWSIEHALQESEPGIERTPEMLSRRIMAVNFAATHTTTLVVNALLLDLLSESGGETIRQLTKESQNVAQDFIGQDWSRPRILRHIRLDSALRESMRLSGFLQRALMRKVVAPQGVTLPDGTYLPHDTVVCVSGQALHHDPSTFSDAFFYNPERFLSSPTPTNQTFYAPEHQDPTASKPSTPGSPIDVSESRQRPSPQTPSRKGLTKTAVESDSNHLSWGLGRHACPGRFLAVDLVKMIVLHAITHYDIEPVPRHSAQPWMEFHEVPPIGVKLKVRRKAVLV